MINSYGVVKRFTELKNGKSQIKHLIYDKNIFEIDQILDQIPLRYIFKYMLNKLKRKLF